jgi:hypothetical protein
MVVILDRDFVVKIIKISPIINPPPILSLVFLLPALLVLIINLCFIRKINVDECINFRIYVLNFEFTYSKNNNL